MKHCALQVALLSGSLSKGYLSESLSSEICISPFGYGEICWRISKAVLYGCMVMNPNRSCFQGCAEVADAVQHRYPTHCAYLRFIKIQHDRPFRHYDRSFRSERKIGYVKSEQAAHVRSKRPVRSIGISGQLEAKCAVQLPVKNNLGS
jgi:hypothetical protein